MLFKYNEVYATTLQAEINVLYNHPKGWGNGYVLVGENHPWYGKSYFDIEDVGVHGGVTLSESSDAMSLKGFEGFNGWVFGFDTCHGGDTIERWSEGDVVLETIKFAIALSEISK